jgi:hypothetical protein
MKGLFSKCDDGVYEPLCQLDKEDVPQVHIIKDKVSRIDSVSSSTLVIYCNVKVSQVLTNDGVYQFYSDNDIMSSSMYIKGSSQHIKEVYILSTRCDHQPNLIALARQIYEPHRLVLIMDFPQNYCCTIF